MRQILKGLIAAVAVMVAAPAMACGYTPCGQPVYVAPVAAYAGCNPCGGWVRERLPDPEQQYYYVNQGPTYTGPGNLAPYLVYREGFQNSAMGRAAAVAFIVFVIILVFTGVQRFVLRRER